MKPGIVAAIIVAALVAVGAFVFIASSGEEETTTVNETTQQQTTSPATETTVPTESAEQSTEQLIKSEEVAIHSSGDDCWTIVDGMVYDITGYVPRHPGGSTILAACGTDGSSLFNNRTTQEGETVGSGSPHSSSAARQLASFKIGILDTTAE